MKLSQNPELHAAAQKASATASKQAAKTVGEAAQEASKSAQVAASSVSFSSSTKELTSVGRATSEFDADRVKAMREAIANGTFSVSAEAIADKLLANTGEFLAHSMAVRAA